MEKRLPHYRLSDIQAQMSGVEAMNLTESARIGIRAAGMTRREALEVVLELSFKER